MATRDAPAPTPAAADFTLVPTEAPPPAARVCAVCSHPRRDSDGAPAWQCPRCGVAYDAARAPMAATPAAARPHLPAAAAPQRPRLGVWTVLGLVVLAGAVLLAWKLQHDQRRSAERQARQQADLQAQAVADARAEMARREQVDALLQRSQRGEGDAALAEARQRADAGDLRAQVLVGQMLLRGGPGVPRDTRAGLAALERAAQQGSVLAMLVLGQAYDTGLADTAARPAAQPEQAEHWYSRAARSGDARGLYALGQLYARAPAALGPRPWAAHVVLDLAARRLEAEAATGTAERDALWPGDGSATAARYSLQRVAQQLSPAERAQARQTADAWRAGLPLPR